MRGEKLVWLDDLRPKPDGYHVWIKDYRSFVEFVKNEGKHIPLTYISFDHDLGEGENGYDCAKFLVNWCIDNDYLVPDYAIHSANPVGRENIKSIFESYRKIKEYGKETDVCN